MPKLSPRRRAKAQVGQALLLAGLAVAEGDVLKADKALPLGRFPLIQGENLLIRHHTQHGFNAVGRGSGLAEHHKDAVDAHDALDDQVEVGEEGQNDAGLDLTAVDPVGAHPDHQGESQIEAHLHQRPRHGHDGTGLDVGAGHIVVALGEAALLIVGLGEGFHHADAGDVLAHDPHHVVQTILHPAVEGDAIAGDREHHRHQNGHNHQENGGQHGVHEQCHNDAAQQEHGHADAHGLERLDAGLDIVAVAGHAADEAGKAERVKLAAGEVGSLGEERLADVVGDAVGVVDGDPVGPDVELPGQNGRGDHQCAPKEHQRELPQRHHLVDEVL